MTLTRILQTLTLQQISLACSHPVASIFIGEACRRYENSSLWKKLKLVIFTQSCKKDIFSIKARETLYINFKRNTCFWQNCKVSFFHLCYQKYNKGKESNFRRGNSTKTKTFKFKNKFCLTFVTYPLSNDMNCWDQQIIFGLQSVAKDQNWLISWFWQFTRTLL